MTSVIPIPGWHHGSATMLLRPILDGAHVRYWHLADVQTALMNVRCEGNSGDNVDGTRCLLNDPKRTCLIEGRMSKLRRQKAACC